MEASSGKPIDRTTHRLSAISNHKAIKDQELQLRITMVMDKDLALAHTLLITTLLRHILTTQILRLFLCLHIQVMLTIVPGLTIMVNSQMITEQAL